VKTGDLRDEQRIEGICFSVEKKVSMRRKKRRSCHRQKERAKTPTEDCEEKDGENEETNSK